MHHITCKFHKLPPAHASVRTEIKFLYMSHQDQWKFVDIPKIKTQGNNV